MNVDFERVAMLLDVIHKQAEGAPQLTSLTGAAMEELKKINDEIKAEVVERAKARRQKDDEAVQSKNEEVEVKANAKPHSFPSTKTEQIADNNVSRRV